MVQLQAYGHLRPRCGCTHIKTFILIVVGKSPMIAQDIFLIMCICLAIPIFAYDTRHFCFLCFPPA